MRAANIFRTRFQMLVNTFDNGNKPRDGSRNFRHNLSTVNFVVNIVLADLYYGLFVTLYNLSKSDEFVSNFWQPCNTTENNQWMAQTGTAILQWIEKHST